MATGSNFQYDGSGLDSGVQTPNPFPTSVITDDEWKDATNQASAAPKPGDPTPTGPDASPNAGIMAIDWRSWLTDWGFPSDLISTLDGMARRYTPAQAELFARDAILFLRGTEWHKKTFVGFAEGFNKGLFTDERGYRMYVNAANDSYKRYMGRDITTPELIGAFGSSWSPERVERELEAGAFVNANRNDLQYLGRNFGEGGAEGFSEDQLKAYGQQSVGIGNALGAGLVSKVAQAQQRLRRIFEGTLATPSLGVGPVGRISQAGSGSTLSDVGR